MSGSPRVLPVRWHWSELPLPEIKAAGHDRCIINLREENVEAWLTPIGRTDDELQAMLSDRQQPYYEHEVMAA